LILTTEFYHLVQGLEHLKVPRITFERSERIYAAMLSRGYEGKIRTLSFFRLGKRDFFFIFLFHIFLVFVVIVL
jgi:energy-coupling factor transporter transmembrane protein EcfT